MKKILVPTDFSECAKNALKAASDIARKSEAEIHLVHVYQIPVWGFAEANVDIIKNRLLHEKIEKELYKTANFDFLSGLKVRKHIFTDMKIHDALKSKTFVDADLIVMGSHGISGWREFFIGSNTEKVVRLIEFPVLVIKEWYVNFEIKNMIFASNFSSETDSVFVNIKKIAEIFQSKIHLLKIITPGNFEPSNYTTEAIKKLVRKFYLANYSINVYNDETVEDGVLNFSKSIESDCIAIETHGRTGFAHLINGSIAEKLVNHIELPVLSIKIKFDSMRY